jgi:hypothetical protein
MIQAIDGRTERAVHYHFKQYTLLATDRNGNPEHIQMQCTAGLVNTLELRGELDVRLSRGASGHGNMASYAFYFTFCSGADLLDL